MMSTYDDCLFPGCNFGADSLETQQRLAADSWRSLPELHTVRLARISLVCNVNQQFNKLTAMEKQIFKINKMIPRLIFDLDDKR